MRTRFDVLGLTGERRREDGEREGKQSAPGLGVYAAWLGGLPGWLGGAHVAPHAARSGSRAQL